HFLAQPMTGLMAAKALLFLERYQEVLDRFPDRREQCCDALTALGRPELVVERYPDQRGKLIEALKSMARFDEIRARGFGDDPSAFDVNSDYFALFAAGRFEDILARWPDDPQTLLATGRFDQLLHSDPGNAS